MIDKGVISAIKDGGSKAEVVPATSKSSVTTLLAVSEMLVDFIKVGDEVVYAMFDDNTGLVLAKLDGTWSHKIKGKIEVTEKVIAGDVQTSSVASLNGHKHNYTHGGTSSGADKTSGPV